MFAAPAFKKILFCIACIFCGWVGAFAMPQVSFWPAMFAGLSGLYVLYAKTQKATHAFAAGFFFGIGYFVTGLWWIGNALLVEGSDFAWVWPISVIGLPTLLSLFTGTYLAIARMMTDPKTYRGFAAFVFFLTFSEWARGNAFTGFPWNLYGYVWSDHLPMAQAAHYLGAYGLTIVSVAWAAMAGFLITGTQKARAKIISAALVVITMGLTYAGGKARLENETFFNPRNAVIVVQPNIAQNMKWDPVAVQENFEKTVSLSRAAQFADNHKPENIIIVWPETAISPSIYTKPENMERLQELLRHYRGSNTYLATGILRRFENPPGTMRHANSIALFDSDLTALSVYDKFHLVPFGEFIPFQSWIPLTPVTAFKGFERGNGATTVMQGTIPAFSPLICYEIIFPDVVTQSRESRPQWILNVTNDGWYGDSAGPHQHYAQSRLRAIEEGMPVIRSANTGISAIFDPYGRTVDSAGIFSEAALVSSLPRPVEDHAAPQRRAVHILFPFIALILQAFLLVRLRSKKSP